MSGHKKRRWEKFGSNEGSESSSSSEDEYSSETHRGKKSSTSTVPRTQNEFTKQIQFSESAIGPALPTNLLAQREIPATEKLIGPAFPSYLSNPKRIESTREIGPTFPPYLLAQQKKDNETIGPALPPQLLIQEQGESDKEIGPALPPHLLSKQQKVCNETKTFGPALPPQLLIREQEKSEKEIGPALSIHLVSKQPKTSNNTIGPTLPPNLSQKVLAVDDTIGPILPPHLLEKERKACMEEIGPALPPHLLEHERHERIVGPQLPDDFKVESDGSSDDGETIGPDPSLMSSSGAALDISVAERAERSRKKLLGLGGGKQERESWMLELPPEKAANIGLGARQFRAKLAPEMGDRTVWTDTPSDKAKKEGRPPKVDDKEICRKQLIAERDRLMEKMARKAEKKLKRNESLLESHSKKIKKEAKEMAKKAKDEPKMRKMFSREDDMQVHRFDEAQKKAIFKKAQFLNDRFSQGESKFL